VGLELDGHGQVVVDPDDAGVLARPLQYVLAAGG
jgi:hypothetical protein